MTFKKGDRIVWKHRQGTVMDLDTSAQNTSRGRSLGWPFAAWVLFDDVCYKGQNSWYWSCVNALECILLETAP